jgi:hypothetical protein
MVRAESRLEAKTQVEALKVSGGEGASRVLVMPVHF